MKFDILGRPDFSLLKLTSDAAGEVVMAESGAMVSMSTGIELKTQAKGGIAAAAKRKLLGGESFFQNTFTASAPGQEIWLAPGSEGDIASRELRAGEVFFLQSGCYLGHIGQQMAVDTKWGGVKGFFTGVGAFLIRVTGPGLLFYSTYGAVRQVDISGAPFAVDTGHIVGFTDGVSYKVRAFGGVKGFFFSGEGLVADFAGNGSVLLQTRNPKSLAAFLEPFRPQKSN